MGEKPSPRAGDHLGKDGQSMQPKQGTFGGLVEFLEQGKKKKGHCSQPKEERDGVKLG